jgi:NAD(P)H-nitrite reductase large subunit
MWQSRNPYRLKKFQDNKNKEYEKTQTQIHETIGALKKHQSETENTINRQIKELRMKIDNIKKEVAHDMENLRKKNETEMQSKKEAQTKTSRRWNLRT